MDSIGEALMVFRASADRFVAALANVSDITWVFRPSQSVWSMAEVIEHVTMTDRGIRGLVSSVLRPFEAGERSAVDDAAIATIFDGDGPLPRDAEEPSGTWTDRTSALRQFSEASAALAAWYDGTDVDLRSLTYAHPIFGLLDGVQWLLFAASHHDNHTRDVLELRDLASVNAQVASNDQPLRRELALPDSSRRFSSIRLPDGSRTKAWYPKPCVCSWSYTVWPCSRTLATVDARSSTSIAKCGGFSAGSRGWKRCICPCSS